MNTINLTEDADGYIPRQNAKDTIAKLVTLQAELQAIEPTESQTLPNGLYKMTREGELIPARFSRPRRHHRPEGVLLQFNSRLVPKA